MDKPRLTEEGVRTLLARECRDAGGQSAWADLHNVTAAYVCDVLQGRRNVGKAIAAALGLQRVTFYEQASPESAPRPRRIEQRQTYTL